MARLRSWLPVLLALGFGAVLVSTASLWIASWLIPPRESALREERAIGGFDPHLHVSVQAVRRASDGRFTVVLRARNSALESDVASGRLRVEVRDAAGEIYPPFEAARFPGRLPAGGQVDVPFVFELPPDARRPMLWIYPDDLLTRWVPGGARSPLTPKLTFALEPEAAAP